MDQRVQRPSFKILIGEFFASFLHLEKDLIQRGFQWIMNLLEFVGLLIQLAAAIIDLQSPAIEPVEFRDAFQPSLLSSFETLVALPTLKEIPANLRPSTTRE